MTILFTLLMSTFSNAVSIEDGTPFCRVVLAYYSDIEEPYKGPLDVKVIKASEFERETTSDFTHYRGTFKFQDGIQLEIDFAIHDEEREAGVMNVKLTTPRQVVHNEVHARPRKGRTHYFVEQSISYKSLEIRSRVHREPLREVLLSCNGSFD